MVNRGIREYRVDKETEEAIKNYFLGNISSLTALARELSRIDGKTVVRQQAVNMIANVIPYWCRIGKVNVGHSADTVEGLENETY